MNPTNKSSIVAKCVGIVDLLADGNRAMGFTEIVERSGLVKSSAHRILGILVSEKLIELNPGDKKYWLGPKMMNWAVSVWHHADIQQAVTNELDELAESCRHNVALAVLGDKGVLYLRTVETYQLRYVPKAGEQAPPTLFSGWQGDCGLPAESKTQFIDCRNRFGKIHREHDHRQASFCSGAGASRQRRFCKK